MTRPRPSRLPSNLRSNPHQTRCFVRNAPLQFLQLALVIFSAHAQDSQTSLNEVISNVNLNTPLDPEELEMAKTMLVQDLQEKALKQDMAWPLPTNTSQDSAKRGEPFELADAHDNGAVVVDDAPVEVTIEDTPTIAPKSTKNASAPTAAVPQGSMDGAVGIVRTRLASEEQFNARLQKLLQQSASESRTKQQKIELLEAQLRKASQQQQQLSGDSAVKASQEETEIARQTARADTVEKQLRRTSHDLGESKSTVAWLRDRVNTLLARLGSVTHIGKVLEKELVEKNSAAASMKHKLATIQDDSEVHHKAEMEAGLRKFKADAASQEAQVLALQHQNKLLQQRLHSLDKRDKILQHENKLLRGQMRSKVQQVQGTQEELEKVKTALEAAQNTSIQVQSKYADSLKAMITSQASGQDSRAAADANNEEAGSASAAQEDGQENAETQASTDSNDDNDSPDALLELSHDSSSLPEKLSRDSNSLTELMQDSTLPSIAPLVAQAKLKKVDQHQKSQMELSRDSQGLSTLLNGISERTR